MRQSASLDALNFALAGAREGFGPFLGVYLQQQGWGAGAIGVAMGAAGFAGVISNAPIGAFIDRTHAKRAVLVAAVAAIALGAVMIVLVDSRWLVGLAQLAIGVADDAVAPLVAALTLGLVGERAYGDRVGRNEVFNHAGNAASAALAGVLGYCLGLDWVAVSIIVMAVVSSAAVLSIPRDAIDHSRARGGEPAAAEPAWRTLLASRPLLVLAGTAFLLQTANGAMLPFLAQARTAAGSDPSTTTAVMVVAAQVTMVGAAATATLIARRRGHEVVLTLALGAVVVRSLVAAFADGWLLVLAAQGLEGIAMGFAGVAIPSLAAGLMAGTGRTNAGLGGVLAAFGAGAMLSPLVAGFGADSFGYPTAFLAMGACAVLGAILWIVAGPSPSRRAEAGIAGAAALPER